MEINEFFQCIINNGEFFVFVLNNDLLVLFCKLSFKLVIYLNLFIDFCKCKRGISSSYLSIYGNAFVR